MAGLKTLAKAQLRVRPRVRTVEVLSPDLEERLFAHAQILSEGRTSEVDRTYYGTSLISVDLADLGELPATPRDCAALAQAIEGSVRVHLRAMRIARTEALQRADVCDPGTAQVEIRVRLRDEAILELDVDIAIALEADVAYG